ncbi:MAG: serine hydroxymethyltransferase [Candidatus Eisenbacteria bacterium RBG_16_71_46]|nr:MAG: serine hydroxymethyltransferase [Candidatus Eisenbacteria bacterium RBG_16_71_46]OGF26036.1 MAG: serine hydroxymethyltransferase [Candidatus Eisenbacteria bacterium RBG_19FT_COMBO_70_11]
MSDLEHRDPAIFEAIAAERRRQMTTLELIASENFVSDAVLEAMGSVMTNKYAEGLPGRRYYGGCEFVDVAETLAIERLKQLFAADHANVQSHSGASANLAAYLAVSKPGDVLLGMSLAHGGHLTHGHPVSYTGQLWRSVQYGVRAEDGRIDYEQVASLARQHRPRIIVAGASAYPRIIDFERFSVIAREVGAALVVDMAHIAGLVATGLHPSPVPHADLVTSTTHKTLRGPRGGFVLCRREHAEKLDKSVFPGLQGGPLMHVIAAKAVCLGEALGKGFGAYQRRVVENARALAAGLLEHDFDLVSGGTDNHLVLVDLRRRGLTGKVAEEALQRARITVNKNAVPNDPQKPWVTSGIRIGSPALTTRGFGDAEMRRIADWIAQVLERPDDAERARAIEREVLELCARYPLFARDPVLR